MATATIEVINPFDQSVVRRLETDSDDRVAEALDNADRAFARWRGIPLDERRAHVRAGLETIRERREAIAREVTVQMGKPLAQALGEVDTLLDRGRQSLEDAPSALADDVLPEKAGFRRRIVHEPLGVVLNVAAWNYPLVIPINVVVPALLAGNSVLLKHSNRTGLTGQAVAAAALTALATTERGSRDGEPRDERC